MCSVVAPIYPYHTAIDEPENTRSTTTCTQDEDLSPPSHPHPSIHHIRTRVRLMGHSRRIVSIPPSSVRSPVRAPLAHVPKPRSKGSHCLVCTSRSLSVSIFQQNSRLSRDCTFRYGSDRAHPLLWRPTQLLLLHRNFDLRQKEYCKIEYKYCVNIWRNVYCGIRSFIPQHSGSRACRECIRPATKPAGASSPVATDGRHIRAGADSRHAC